MSWLQGLHGCASGRSLATEALISVYAGVSWSLGSSTSEGDQGKAWGSVNSVSTVAVPHMNAVLEAVHSRCLPKNR